jgi:hypothetical protein
MKTQKKQTQPENKKRDYARPKIKKRGQIKEITEGPGPTVTLSVK